VKSIRVGIIGCGYWGPNLVRNFARNPYSEVEAVCDMRYERAMRVGAEYRIPTVTDHPEELLASPDLDLIVVATPSFSHFPLAKAALEAGKHVLVMKPLATRTEHAEERREPDREHRVSHGALRRLADRARARELAGPGQGAAHHRGWVEADDDLRRYGGE
jgi:predicted dehydrogenase